MQTSKEAKRYEEYNLRGRDSSRKQHNLNNNRTWKKKFDSANGAGNPGEANGVNVVYRDLGAYRTQSCHSNSRLLGMYGSYGKDATCVVDSTDSADSVVDDISADSKDHAGYVDERNLEEGRIDVVSVAAQSSQIL